MGFSSRIQTGGKEPIEVLVRDVLGAPLTGLADIKMNLRRLSDNFYLDWADNTFKSSPTQILQALVEIDDTNSPGEYKLNKVGHVNGFDTSSIVSPNADDIYEFTVDQDGGTDAKGLPLIGEIKVGGFVDQIPDFSVNERTEIKTVLGVTGTGTPNDSPASGVMSVILGLVQSNFFLDQTIYNSSGLLTSGRIRIFPTKAATDLATDGGAGEGELASFAITSVAEVSPLDMMPKTYKVTREP
jgi:hypothetical protein